MRLPALLLVAAAFAAFVPSVSRADSPAAEKAAKLIYPKLVLRDATPEEAVQFLMAKSKEVDSDKAGVRISLSGPETGPEVRIKLDLRDVSVVEAIKQVAAAAKLEVETGDSFVLKGVLPEPPLMTWPPTPQFRLLFSAYDADPEKPDAMRFQINTIDQRQAPKFLKIGEFLRGTKLQLESFQKKTARDAEGAEKDASELTLRNSETNVPVVLHFQQAVDARQAWDGRPW